MRKFKCVSVNKQGNGLFTVGEVYSFNLERLTYSYYGTMQSDISVVRCKLNHYTTKDYALISNYSEEVLAVFHAA